MIYIATHTDFNEYKTEGEYTIISANELHKQYSFPWILADNELKPLEFAYAEGYIIKDIYEKTNDEWVGLNHYRRYFDNPTNETTLPTPMYCNIHQQYAICHNIEDLIKCENIIDKYYPEYSMYYKKIDKLFPCNMFIMKREDFENYYNFVFGVLDIFNKENNLKTDSDIYNYVANNKDKYNRTTIDLKYQSRLQGFLMERLGTIFFLQYFKDKPVTYKEIKVVSNKL